MTGYEFTNRLANDLHDVFEQFGSLGKKPEHDVCTSFSGFGNENPFTLSKQSQSIIPCHSEILFLLTGHDDEEAWIYSD